MDDFNTSEVSPNEEINKKLRACFDGKIVRKDLTKSIKEGANVPVYVLEFLLGQYCSSDDPSVIEEGVANVKRILADNYVRPDEAQKILSVLRQRGSYTVIDNISNTQSLREAFMSDIPTKLNLMVWTSVGWILAGRKAFSVRRKRWQMHDGPFDDEPVTVAFPTAKKWAAMYGECF